METVEEYPTWIREWDVEEYLNWLRRRVEEYPFWLWGGDVEEYPTWLQGAYVDELNVQTRRIYHLSEGGG